MAGQTYLQMNLLPVAEPRHQPKTTDSTFVDNMKLPVHRWFRYSAGFSAQWVESLMTRVAASAPISVLDPFAGSGTTLLAAERCGAASYGIEAHPFVARVARAKLHYRSDADAFLDLADRVRLRAKSLTPSIEGYPSLIRRCFDDQSLAVLDTLRRAWESQADGSPASELVWLALISILRQVSHAGTAPWQYVLPGKTKKQPWHPIAAFDQTVRTMWSDMKVSGSASGAPGQLLQTDARTCEGVPDRFATLVITSPPYPNNYDYADATRLEMSFTGEIGGWADLQTAVRKHLVRSCSQHVPERDINLEELAAAPELAPISVELRNTCHELDAVRHLHGGKKTYHLMVAAYFLDMAQTWVALRRVCQEHATVCFVIGDSAPYGVHVPVIEWMGRLALAAGFKSYEFEKTRDRNVKWKNRKHRVPLVEGRLWVNG